ncbi:MAG TPA: nucleotide pyrophosphatase/phosphodiesterase family protein [Tepidisphaeraceae bacterium]|jgi:predicted AlkP superfamily pyrophosphatase or phosphodiesterase
MRKTVVINAVGLTARLIGEHTPALKAFLARGKLATIEPSLPAVTCTVQSTYLTGKTPAEHGIVGNGWFFRDTQEIRFWHQSNHLVQGPKVWDVAKQRDPNFTCANICWWYAMYSGADYVVTPRPMYPSDGRKIADVWTKPADLRTSLQQKLGQFPLFKFWGPATGIEATHWIAEAAMEVDRQFDPALSLIYLPHLDYVLQRGTDPAEDLRELDEVIAGLLKHFQEANVIILSEYGISAVSRPVHINRILREMGLIAVREELGRELLDAGASRAFAVADHQVAHVYVNDPAVAPLVARELKKTEGIAQVFEGEARKMIHLDHPRAGDIIALAERDSWFTYYYWMDDARAPDFARTVEIHKKPGYDPVELFLDPAIRFPKAKIASVLARRKILGQRPLMEVIPLDATLVKGSHGLAPSARSEGPVFITSASKLLDRDHVEATDVMGLILRHLGLE